MMLFRSSLLLLLFSVPLQAGKYNPTLKIGQASPIWEKLPGTDGKQHSLSDLKEKEVVVLVFTCNSCPYSMDYEDRIIAFAKKHCGKDSKVALVAVNVNKVEEDSLPAMKEKAEKKKFSFPYLFDESQKIAHDFGATWTPEFFVLNRERKIVYMGAMDDSTDAKRVTKHHLEEAVVATLSGEEVKVAETIAIGCRVRYERRRRSRSRKKVSEK